MSSNLPKSQPNFKTDFSPMKLGQKSVKHLVGFWGDLKTQKIHSKINWALIQGASFLWSALVKKIKYWLNVNPSRYYKKSKELPTISAKELWWEVSNWMSKQYTMLRVFRMCFFLEMYNIWFLLGFYWSFWWR